jgi:hypothetical protein
MEEVTLSAVWWLWGLLFIPFVDTKPGQGFLPDVSSEDVYGPPPPPKEGNTWYPPEQHWTDKSKLDEYGIGLVAMAIVLFSKPWK